MALIVVQSTAPPPGTVSGPHPTQAAAQQVATGGIVGEYYQYHAPGDTSLNQPALSQPLTLAQIAAVQASSALGFISIHAGPVLTNTAIQFSRVSSEYQLPAQPPILPLLDYTGSFRSDLDAWSFYREMMHGTPNLWTGNGRWVLSPGGTIPPSVFQEKTTGNWWATCAGGPVGTAIPPTAWPVNEVHGCGLATVAAPTPLPVTVPPPPTSSPPPPPPPPTPETSPAPSVCCITDAGIMAVAKYVCQCLQSLLAQKPAGDLPVSNPLFDVISGRYSDDTSKIGSFFGDDVQAVQNAGTEDEAINQVRGMITWPS